MTPKRLQTIIASAALAGLTVRVTNALALAGMATFKVQRHGRGPVVRFLFCDGILRIDAPCPAGHSASDWATECNAVAVAFEGLLQ